MFDLNDLGSKDLGSKLCSLVLEPATNIEKNYRKHVPLLELLQANGRWTTSIDWECLCYSKSTYVGHKYLNSLSLMLGTRLDEKKKGRSELLGFVILKKKKKKLLEAPRSKQELKGYEGEEMSLFLLVDAFKKTLKDICRKTINGNKLVFVSFIYCKWF